MKGRKRFNKLSSRRAAIVRLRWYGNLASLLDLMSFQCHPDFPPRPTHTCLHGGVVLSVLITGSCARPKRDAVTSIYIGENRQRWAVATTVCRGQHRTRPMYFVHILPPHPESLTVALRSTAYAMVWPRCSGVLYDNVSPDLSYLGCSIYYAIALSPR